MTHLSILPITADDLPFVREMLREAAFWRGTASAPPVDQVLDEPALARYVEGWGRPGDAGFVARVGGSPAGAVWVRRFRDDEHGYGFVDEQTPELTVAVAQGRRGVGLGRCLVTAMLAALRLEAVDQVSLSVEDDNVARTLYASLGFVEREAADGATTMVRTLCRVTAGGGGPAR